MLKLHVRENMKRISRILLIALIVCGTDAYAAAPVATTVGSNLTAFNGNSGSTNNATWNSYMNPRTNVSSSAPTADFSSCNALIMRCVQPKCVTGGCTSLDVTKPIVAGCIASNEACKQYEEQLTETIAAQIVANTTAKANEQATNAQIAAAQASAQQSAQQMAQMQQQMVELQQQLQQQSATTAAQIQSALAQQQQTTNQAIADAAAASSAATVAAMPTQTTAASSTNITTGLDGLSTAQQLAAASGVSADVLAREQIAGQVLTSVENAEVALKDLKAVLSDVYTYAGCDSSGNNCTGPKRIKIFKQKAMNFFEPYNDVLSELYDALILAQSVGVDITDIYMMLNGTCNVWAQYLCAPGQVMHYTSTNCINGVSVPIRNANETGSVVGGANCKIGQVVPMSDGGCQLTKMLTNNEDVQKSWLYPEIGSGYDSNNAAQVRVGCASEALENSSLFSNMKKQASIDIETLQRIIEQDAPSVYGTGIFKSSSTKPNPDGIKFCGVGSAGYADLQKLVSLKQLPDSVCVSDNELNTYVSKEGIGGLIVSTNNERIQYARLQCQAQQLDSNKENSTIKNFSMLKCLCEEASYMALGTDVWPYWDGTNCVCATKGYKFSSNTLKCEPDTSTSETENANDKK